MAARALALRQGRSLPLVVHVVTQGSGGRPLAKKKENPAVASKIHLICRDQLGLRCIDAKANIHTSSAWRLSPEDAAALVNGTVYFHQTKSEPSYFGGAIQSLEAIEALPGDDEIPGRQRYVLTLKSTAEAKGARWDKRGLSHGMAWSSGVIKINE
jgi:hypothetical protein